MAVSRADIGNVMRLLIWCISSWRTHNPPRTLTQLKPTESAADPCVQSSIEHLASTLGAWINGKPALTDAKLSSEAALARRPNARYMKQLWAKFMPTLQKALAGAQ